MPIVDFALLKTTNWPPTDQILESWSSLVYRIVSLIENIRKFFHFQIYTVPLYGGPIPYYGVKLAKRSILLMELKWNIPRSILLIINSE